MIKFFRKIRQNLLSEGKTGKYLKYAIGEIILVVIGILIAVQINKLNEASKNRQLEKNYLHGIIQNLDQDIISLQNHIYVQTYKLDVFTILIKAFTDEHIRSDHHLLKHAVIEAYGYYDFDPQRYVFDGMRSAGILNLIQSIDLRNIIQSHYVQTTAVVNTEAVYNEEIINHQRQIFTNMININSLLDFGFELKWQSKLVDDDLSFFNKDFNDTEVKEFANRTSDIKRFTETIISREKNLQNSAEELKTKIKEYLGEVEDKKSDEITKELKTNIFIPSIPQNAIAITDNQLSEYIGTFELIKRDSISGSFTEKDRVHINLENNHLVVYYQSGETPHSFYFIENDKFKRATSFLFDDPISEAIMNFIRNEDHKIINVVIKDFWNGTSQYKKIQ